MRGRVHHLTYVLMSLALMCTAPKPSENLSVRKLGQGRLVAQTSRTKTIRKWSRGSGLDKREDSEDEVLRGGSSLREAIPNDPLEPTSDLVRVGRLEENSSIRRAVEPVKFAARGTAIHAYITIGTEVLESLPRNRHPLGILEIRP